jgi:hypothetical protein
MLSPPIPNAGSVDPCREAARRWRPNRTRLTGALNEGAQGPRLEGRRGARLLGPRGLSYAEATRILGERIGKPDLKYVQFSYADTAKALVQAGLSESFAGLYVEMTRAFNEGKVKPREGRTSENTTPTRFEDFAGELARAYQAA